MSALAGVVAELHDALGLGQVHLAGNDTGGAVAQVFAARHPDRLRTLTLTNCDTDGNFPPPEFIPIIEIAKRGELAASLVWRDYLQLVGGTLDRARDIERLLASLDPKDLTDVQDALRALDVPTLIVWGTGDATFGVTWAYLLRGTIAGARDVIEVDGAKIFFPDERPGDLVPHLRGLWGR